MSKQPNLIDLRQSALDKLGSIAEVRMRVYTGRKLAEPLEIRAIERRYKHLEAIDTLFTAFEQSANREGVA